MDGHGRKFFIMKQLVYLRRILVIILFILSATPEFTDTSLCSSGTDSSAGTLDTTVYVTSIRPEEQATTNFPTQNDATSISFSSQGRASGAEDGTEARTSEHVGTERITAAESSTNIETIVPSETSDALSTETGTSEYTSTTASGRITAESSTNSATSDRSETTDATSTEEGTSENVGKTDSGSTSAESSTNSVTSLPARTSNKMATSSGISTGRSTTPKVCNEYLGMENGDVPDDNIVASPNSHRKGRLNGAVWYCVTSQCSSEATTWIQTDIGYQTYVSGVITQGSGNANWVTELKVSTFEMTTDDQQVFVTDENGTVKVFQANTDANTPVTSSFPNPVHARIVRITCVIKNSNIIKWKMRFEILGCKKATQ